MCRGVTVNLIHLIHREPVFPYPNILFENWLEIHRRPNEALSCPLPHPQRCLPAGQWVPLQIKSMEQLVKLERMQGMRPGPSAAPWPEMRMRLSSRRHLSGIIHKGRPNLGEDCLQADISRQLQTGVTKNLKTLLTSSINCPPGEKEKQASAECGPAVLVRDQRANGFEMLPHPDPLEILRRVFDGLVRPRRGRLQGEWRMWGRPDLRRRQLRGLSPGGFDGKPP